MFWIALLKAVLAVIVLTIIGVVFWFLLFAAIGYLS
jgi:hypothetical protein